MKKARFELIVSMVIFGTLGLFVRHISLASAELALWRAVLASVLIGGYLFASKHRIVFSEIKKELPLLLASGAVLGMNWIFLFEAYQYTSVSIATLSYYFAPVLVTVLCPVIFKEKLTKKQLFCFAMSTVGVVMIIGVSGLGNSGSDLTGIFWGLSAAVLYAAVILFNKMIKNIAGIPRTFLQFLSAIIVLLPYVICKGGLHIFSLNRIGFLNLLIVGLIHTGITYCMYFSSLKELQGQEAALLSYIDPLTAVFVSVLFLNESISLMQAVGGGMILGFAVWNEKNK